MNASPSSHSIRIGDYTVTAFSDGEFETKLDVAVGIDPESLQRITGKTPMDLIEIAVNVYLLEGRGIRALVDAGSGVSLGPKLGKLPTNLSAAGIAFETITHVLLTHIHPDHSNGLIDARGNPYFPNAEIVVQETEIKFWVDRDLSQAAHDRQRHNMMNARRALAPYASRTTRVEDGEILPGVHMQMSPGHTPGHSTWTIEGGGDSLMIWGDTIHMAFLQLIDPHITWAYDSDPAMAIESRLRLLDRVRADQTRIAGMHLDFPGLGRVRKDPSRWFIDVA
jgi:glyoxylase-like metal-dependent hydrolase (beta-lactamase superfamily II)